MPEPIAALIRPQATWAELGFTSTDIAVERLDEIYRRDVNQEERVWDRLPLIAAPVSAVLVKRWSSIASAGFSVAEGSGGRASFYASFARAMMGMRGWPRFVEDILQADLWGWRFFEAVPRRDTITIERRSVHLPERMYGYKPWLGEFLPDRNFRLRSDGAIDQLEHTYQTNGLEGFHVDQIRWTFVAFGDSSSPYGESSIRNAWLPAQRYHRLASTSSKRTPWALGLVRFDGKNSGKSFDEIKREGLKVLETMTDDGAIVEKDVSVKVESDSSFSGGIDETIKGLKADIYELLTGSALSQTVGSSGNRALGVVHEHSTEAVELALARNVAESLRSDWLVNWLAFNGFFPDPDELPRFMSGLEPKVSEGYLALAATVTPSSVDWAATHARHHLDVLDPDDVPFEKPAAPVIAAPAQEAPEDDVDGEDSPEDGAED